MKNYTDYIRNVENFPNEGVLFKDITPLLNNFEARKQILADLLEKCVHLKIDKVVGIEARGFFFGMDLANHLGAGFVPLRKAGKLPFTTVSQAYGLEYGNDVLEMHTDAIQKGERVLIHDDVLATGGTVQAACQLVEQLGGQVVQLNFIMELNFLNGREKVANYDVESVLQY